MQRRILQNKSRGASRFRIPGRKELLSNFAVRRASAVEVLPHPDGLESLWVVAPEFDADFEVFGACPVEAVGTVCGRDLYFHTRHERWSFEVADDFGNTNGHSADKLLHEGDHPGADWMSHQQAAEIIIRCLREYTGQ